MGIKHCRSPRAGLAVTVQGMIDDGEFDQVDREAVYRSLRSLGHQPSECAASIASIERGLPRGTVIMGSGYVWHAGQWWLLGVCKKTAH
jgi:hypothetical protein